MASTYTSFLDSPNTSLLAHNASINYITTTTTISEATAVLKHLVAQNKHLDIKERKILNAIESSNGLCLETETTFLFKSGGGVYLPQLDENLLDERSATIPIVHVVQFADDGKIQTIRLYWDQSTLLRQVEAIGRSGRNWPIRDGQAQVKTIKASIEAAGMAVGAGMNGTKPPSSRHPNEVVINQHKKRDSVSATRDPHASLSLFAPRDPNENTGERYTGPKHAPRVSAKPAPRDYGELFAGEEGGAPDTPSRSRSPTKADGVVLKSGAGKYFSNNRLFDDTEDDSTLTSPERKKTYQQKYEHFHFGDGEDAPTTSRPTTSSGRSQTNSHFSFEDFTTPPKPSEKNSRKDYDRHWGSGVDEDDAPSPPKRPIVHEPRKDSQPQFAIADDSPAGDPTKAKTRQRPNGAGLYHDPVVDEDATPKQSSRNTTSTDVSRRENDFAPHHNMANSSPADTKQAAQHKKQNSRGGLQPNWGFDESPVQRKKIYKTAGDGMGGRSGARSWGIGDDSDPEVDTDVRPTARSRMQAKAGADEF